ncbi:hypothetical protein K469DRAFT_755768 [Zopfia rhizophila CBS 207.26]|uniref:Uncharacterized protein n=1 Tax=Zopfia rhizophila CBS 207.26 TaxID=1314779 RepID=A0A6A6DCS3_9PEZI|nr:hypothetical protein K469DRAFT_755768 [Zopfia rhizophila CBS 207.26]
MITIRADSLRVLQPLNILLLPSQDIRSKIYSHILAQSVHLIFTDPQTTSQITLVKKTIDTSILLTNKQTHAEASPRTPLKDQSVLNTPPRIIVDIKAIQSNPNITSTSSTSSSVNSRSLYHRHPIPPGRPRTLPIYELRTLRVSRWRPQLYAQDLELPSSFRRTGSIIERGRAAGYRMGCQSRNIARRKQDRNERNVEIAIKRHPEHDLETFEQILAHDVF